MTYTRRPESYTTVALSTATTLTNPIVMDGKAIVGIIVESTAWTAANLTFQVAKSPGSTDFFNLYDDAGTEITATVGGASRAVGIDNFAGSLAPWPAFKIRSGTAAIPVTQADPRVITIVTKG